MESRSRIAVLFHEGDRHLPTKRYIVHYLADFWRQAGHHVEFLFGTRHYVPADLLLVHVNLSVVPEPYLAFAAQYPIALNHKVRDIRKSTISSNLLTRADEWDGPVIVKSNLNYGGLPERMLLRTWLDRTVPRAHDVRLKYQRWRGQFSPIAEANEYRIFERLSDVPISYAGNEHLVVEKFLPEIEDNMFFTRVYQFLGDRWSCTRMGAPDPLVKATRSVSVEPVEPHPEVVEWRQRLGIDYGKLDYVVCDGQAILLDVNKTIGASLYTGSRSKMTPEQIAANRQFLAEGIYAYM